MTEPNKTAQELLIHTAECRCKRCHKLLFKFTDGPRRLIEIVCTKCKYKQTVLI